MFIFLIFLYISVNDVGVKVMFNKQMNQIQHYFITFFLYIISIADKPEIMDTPSPSIVEGENLTLTCSTRANPIAHSYKWTKIGDNTLQQLRKTLVITDIRRTQSGIYNCTAMNTMTPTNGQPETGEGHGEVT
ncbi:hypothetical protein KUTeg_005928, partial [Tegillarca granosa]